MLKASFPKSSSREHKFWGKNTQNTAHLKVENKLCSVPPQEAPNPAEAFTGITHNVRTQSCADVLMQKWQAKLLSLLFAPFTSWHPSVPKNPSPSRTKPRLPLDQGSLNCCAQGTNNREEKPEELDELCSTRSVFGNTDFKAAWEFWKRPTWFYRCQFCNKSPLKFKAELRQTVLWLKVVVKNISHSKCNKICGNVIWM